MHSIAKTSIALFVLALIAVSPVTAQQQLLLPSDRTIMQASSRIADTSPLKSARNSADAPMALVFFVPTALLLLGALLYRQLAAPVPVRRRSRRR